VAALTPDPAILVDVAVIGGGLGGLPLAIALARSGVRTAIIDRDAPETQLNVSFDGRTTAVAATSQRVLEGIGVWPLLADKAEPILDIRVTDQGSPLFLHFDHRAVGEHPFGWIVENQVFRQALQSVAATLPDLVTLAPAAVAGFTDEGGRIAVALTDGSIVRARLLVGADGKRSAVRDWAGIGTLGTAYRQQSIICTVAHERPHQGVAVENFLPGGPFAILPLQGNRSSIVWTERQELVASLLALPDDEFERRVALRVGKFLGEISVVTRPVSYKLEVMVARRVAAHRVALVGDAAHVIHPIAGQGLNLGLRDVAALAELVVDQCRLGLDPGAPALLRRYEAWRRADTGLLAAATDGLNRLFSNDVAPVRLARVLGLAAVERMPPLKRLFMRRAMGLIPDLPRLADGGTL
jgi:2-octaprenyl-6-methoxyphenol hydroxylase